MSGYLQEAHTSGGVVGGGFLGWHFAHNFVNSSPFLKIKPPLESSHQGQHKKQICFGEYFYGVMLAELEATVQVTSNDGKGHCGHLQGVYRLLKDPNW